MKDNKMNLSYSKVTTLCDCEKRFEYQYISKIEEEPMPIQYGELGSRAHQVLEDFYRYIDIESDDIERNFNKILAKLYHKNFKGINDNKGNMAIGIRNFCVREIQRFNELKDKSLFIPRYSEIPLECDIHDYHFRGRLDAVYIDPDTLKLLPLDYKFTNSNRLDTRHDVQCIIYSEMLQQAMKLERPDTFTFWFLRHGMGPTGRGFSKTINITDELENKVFNIIEDSINIIEKNEYKATMFGSYFCSHFCPYYSTCLEERMGLIFDD